MGNYYDGKNEKIGITKMRVKRKARSAYKYIVTKLMYKKMSNNSKTRISKNTQYKDLKGKAYQCTYNNYLYGIAFRKKSNTAYIGIWNKAGTSASYEDFDFTYTEGVDSYRLIGARSGNYYQINIKPMKNKNRVKINITAENPQDSFFNINKILVYEKDWLTWCLNF